MYSVKESLGYKAEELYRLGYNSAQTVCATFADHYRIDRETALMMGSPFGDGTSRLDGTCGAADALVILSGFEKTNVLPGDGNARESNYRMVRELIGEFKRRYGSVFCRELRNGQCKCTEKCLKYVTGAVEIYADYIGIE